ncbi:Vps62-related protein [Pseudomonas sp. NPDC087814]|uniref:Vps62-related protein n=1 Tax=Pseudomonas sp. NPDC087814 TaxID=3364450 RepID=UPI003821F54C
MNSLQYKDLLINFTTEFVPVWNDKGTRAEKPVTFWRPSTSSDALGNFVPLGDVAVAGYHNINQLNIVAVVSEVDRENGTALRPPVDFERVWEHSGPRARANFSIWRPTAPEGYVAMGLVCGLGNDKPPRNTIRCVREDLVTQAYVDQLIWSDQGSGAHRDFSAWGVSPSQAAPAQAYLAPGTFTGAEGYAKPTRQSPVHALRLDLALHSEDLPPLSPEMAPGRTMPEQVTEGIHVCELPWFTVNDPTLTPLEKLQTCPVYRLKRIDQYSLVASGQNTTPASQTFSWVFAKGEISDFSMGLRALTGVDIKAAWAPRHPLSISANLNRDFTHTGLTAQGWEREGVADVMAYIPANKSIAAYLVKSRYELLRADGSQLGPTLTYASGDNVYFSELLQPEAAVTAVEEPEEVPAEVPEPTENNLEITPHDFIDDTLLP